MPSRTPVTLAANWQKRKDDMVTNFDAGYPIAHHLNHTGTLVPATHWQMSHGHITSGNMIVGMAQT
jgi:hypothetical protein